RCLTATEREETEMTRLAGAGGTGGELAADAGVGRRAFLQGAGAAAGAAAILAAPKVASIARGAGTAGGTAEPKGVVTKPSGPPPREPVTAYVRDAARGEVTVLSGQQETTYKD